ncbi:hypothetical protein JXJ21_12545 [candidate division KSB1 bacterium]|nr:hypothetical protein [candidate division KSB1 bacterium]
MRYRKAPLLLIPLFLILTLNAAASPEFGTGLTLGTSFIHWSYTADDQFTWSLFNNFTFDETYSPQNIGGAFYLVYPSFTARLDMNYGFTQSDFETNTPGGTYDVINRNGVSTTYQVEAFNYLIKTRLRGFSVNTSFLVPFTMGRKRMLSIYPGIGVGYYRYQFSGEWEITDEEIDHNDISTIYTAKGDYENATLAGVAQFFIIGIDVRAVSSLHFFMEFSNIGLCMLTQNRDIHYTVYGADATGTNYSKISQTKIGEIKKNYSPGAGLSDIGITFGIMLIL